MASSTVPLNSDVLKPYTPLVPNSPTSNFRELSVYNKARTLNKDVFLILKNPNYDRNIRDQPSSASTSILLNTAEGSARISPSRLQSDPYRIATGAGPLDSPTTNPIPAPN